MCTTWWNFKKWTSLCDQHQDKNKTTLLVPRSSPSHSPSQSFTQVKAIRLLPSSISSAGFWTSHSWNHTDTLSCLASWALTRCMWDSHTLLGRAAVCPLSWLYSIPRVTMPSDCLSQGGMQRWLVCFFPLSSSSGMKCASTQWYLVNRVYSVLSHKAVLLQDFRLRPRSAHELELHYYIYLICIYYNYM